MSTDGTVFQTLRCSGRMCVCEFVCAVCLYDLCLSVCVCVPKLSGKTTILSLIINSIYKRGRGLGILQNYIIKNLLPLKI